MNIAGIVQQTNKQNFCYDTSAISLDEILKQSDGMHPIVIVMKDEVDNYFFYNLSAIMQKQDIVINGVTDWESLETYLNNLDNTVLKYFKCAVIVPTRMKVIEDNKIKMIITPFRSNAQVELGIFSVENTNEVSASYGSHILPAVRNNKLIKWKLNDLVFTKNRGSKVNFNNTIPFVDGVACYPFIYNDELYALEGSKLLVVNTSPNKNVVLVDFSKFGDLTTYRMSACEYISLDGFDTESIPATEQGSNDGTKHQSTVDIFTNEIVSLKFSLPENAVSGIPFVCIFGRIFSPFNSDVVYYKENKNKTIIQVNIPRFTLERIFASNLQKYNKVIKGTSIIPVSIKNSIFDLFRNRELDVDATVNITNSQYDILNDKNYELVDTNAKSTNRIWKNGDCVISYNTSENRWEIKYQDTLLYYAKYERIIDGETVDETAKCAPWSSKLTWRIQSGTLENNIQLEHNVSEIVSLKYADECIPFVSVLQTNKKLNYSIQTCRRSIGKDKLVFDKDAGGLLINTKTKEVVDYTRVFFKDETLVTIGSYKPLKLSDKENAESVINTNFGFMNHNIVSADQGFNFFDQYTDLKNPDDFVLVDISTTEVIEVEDNTPDEPVVPPEDDESNEGIDLDREFDNVHKDLEEYEETDSPESEGPKLIVNYVSESTYELRNINDNDVGKRIIMNNRIIELTANNIADYQYEDSGEVDINGDPIMILVPRLFLIEPEVLSVTNGIDEIINGEYTIDNSVSGLDRVWKKYDENHELVSIIAYDNVRHWWYIGMEDNHIYESTVSHTGSSPWHRTLNWTYVVDNGAEGDN